MSAPELSDKNWTHFNLPDTKVQEGHALPDFNDGLGTDTTHGCTETSVELEHSKLVEDCWVDGRKDLVRSDLLRLGSLDFVPVTVLSAADSPGTGVRAPTLKGGQGGLTASHP